MAGPTIVRGIGDDAGQRRRGRGQRRREEGPRALALAALEVAVAGAHDVLAGLPPGRRSWRCTSSSRLRATRRRRPGRPRPGLPARPAPSPAASPGTTMTRRFCGDVPAPEEPAAWRRSLMRLLVHEPMKTMSTGWPSSDWPASQAHVVEGVLERPPGRGVRLAVRVGDTAGDGHAHARVGAVGDHRLQGAGVDRDRLRRGCASGSDGSEPPARDRARPSRRPWARAGARRGSRRSCRPARSGRPVRRPRWTCCRWSCALPSTGARMPSPVYSKT